MVAADHGIGAGVDIRARAAAGAGSAGFAPPAPVHERESRSALSARAWRMSRTTWLSLPTRCRASRAGFRKARGFVFVVGQHGTCGGRCARRGRRDAPGEVATAANGLDASHVEQVRVSTKAFATVNARVVVAPTGASKRPLRRSITPGLANGGPVRVAAAGGDRAFELLMRRSAARNSRRNRRTVATGGQRAARAVVEHHAADEKQAHQGLGHAGPSVDGDGIKDGRAGVSIGQTASAAPNAGRSAPARQIAKEKRGKTGLTRAPSPERSTTLHQNPARCWYRLGPMQAGEKRNVAPGPSTTGQGKHLMDQCRRVVAFGIDIGLERGQIVPGTSGPVSTTARKRKKEPNFTRRYRIGRLVSATRTTFVSPP